MFEKLRNREKILSKSIRKKNNNMIFNRLKAKGLIISYKGGSNLESL